MNRFVVAYTGPRGGKWKFELVEAETAAEAIDKFLDATYRTYITAVFEETPR